MENRVNILEQLIFKQTLFYIRRTLITGTGKAVRTKSVALILKYQIFFYVVAVHGHHLLSIQDEHREVCRGRENTYYSLQPAG